MGLLSRSPWCRQVRSRRRRWPRSSGAVRPCPRRARPRWPPGDRRMRDHFAYSSEGRPEGQAFEENAHLYSHGSDVTRGDGPFHARVRAWRHHGFILFDRFMTGLVHSRDARVTTDGYAHLVAHAMLEGELDWSEPDGGKTARAGDILFMDTTQPSRTMPREAHLLTVSIGRHLVEPATGPVGPLHGRLVSPPATLLLTDLARQRGVEGKGWSGRVELGGGGNI